MGRKPLAIYIGPEVYRIAFEPPDQAEPALRGTPGSTEGPYEVESDTESTSESDPEPVPEPNHEPTAAPVPETELAQITRLFQSWVTRCDDYQVREEDVCVTIGAWVSRNPRLSYAELARRGEQRLTSMAQTTAYVTSRTDRGKDLAQKLNVVLNTVFASNDDRELALVIQAAVARLDLLQRQVSSQSDIQM